MSLPLGVDVIILFIVINMQYDDDGGGDGHEEKCSEMECEVTQRNMKIFVGFDVFTVENIYVFLWIMTSCILVGDWKSF